MFRFWLSTWLFHLCKLEEEIVSQPLLSYRAQSEDEVTLECYVSWETYAEIFWLKQPPEGRPTCVAVATAHLLDVHYCKEFKDHPRLTAKRNSYSFNISFSSLDLSDTATYYCGALAYNRVSFGNGTKLLLEEEKQGSKFNRSENQEETAVSGQSTIYDYLVPVLVATNIAFVTVTVVLFYKLQKKKQLENGPDRSLSNTDENTVQQDTETLNYAALHFTRKYKAGISTKEPESHAMYSAIRYQKK